LGEKIHKLSYRNDIAELSPMAQNIIEAILESKKDEMIEELKQRLDEEMQHRIKSGLPTPVLDQAQPQLNNHNRIQK
jgi:predicted RecB family endonuclease